MRYGFILPAVIIILLCLVNPTFAQTQSSPLERIDVDLDVVEGFTGTKSRYNAMLRDDSWSYLNNRRGGFAIDRIHLQKIDLDNYFAGIDFTNVSNWQIRENTTIDASDVGSYTFNLTLYIGDTKVDLNYKGTSLDDSYTCSDADACDFVVALFEIFYDMRDQSSITIPHPLGFAGIVFLLVAVVIPYMFQKNVTRGDRENLITGLEMVAFYLDLFILSVLFLLVLPDTRFVILIAMILAIVIETLIFRFYHNKLWKEDTDNIERNETS